MDVRNNDSEKIISSTLSETVTNSSQATMNATTSLSSSLPPSLPHNDIDSNNSYVTSIQSSKNSAFIETFNNKAKSIIDNVHHMPNCNQVGSSSNNRTAAMSCTQNTSNTSSQDQYDRTLKVAKKGYSDHGSHGVVVQTTLLKKMTTSLQHIYQDNGASISNHGSASTTNNSVTGRSRSGSGTDRRSSGGIDIITETNNSFPKVSSSLSPPQNGSAQRSYKKRISTEKTDSATNIQASSFSSSSSDRIMKHNAESKPITSLLHAALQQQNEIESSNTQQQQCLTNPSEPHSNDGLDNVEGNLIVYKNDMIQVVNKNLHQHKTSSKSSPKKETVVSQLKTESDPLGVTSFQVLDILGQGTFAQVFKCKNIETGKLCAVKIVKNKPAYTRQAAIEIDIFIALSKETKGEHSMGLHLMENKHDDAVADDYIVTLLSYFMHQSHLCLVFELLGSNLYELLKRRQFRGLPISVVRSFVKQALHGTNVLSQKNIVHCDLKPENILVVSDDHIECMVNGKHRNCSKESDTSSAKNSLVSKGSKESDREYDHRIKLIDFGSACFEGQAAHTYIQSRFYRSPEVLIGIDYDAAIDMWSLGCVAAELFLGLPILPGVHEHDQLGRICEMIGNIPDWMLEQGKKSTKYFKREETKPMDENLNMIQAKELTTSSWRLKSREEFIDSLSEEEKERCGGQSKLEQQPTNRYFKKKLLGDIVQHNWNTPRAADKETMTIFIHFLKGILNPDPCERWTAFQASTHPFITGITFRRKNANDLKISKGKMKITKEIYWSTPWDPSVCRRILSLKRNKLSGPSNLHKSLVSHKDGDSNKSVKNRASHLVSPTSRVTDMACAMSISFDHHQVPQSSPTPSINRSHGLRPQFYQTPTSGPHSAHHAQPPNSLSISLHEPLNLRLDPPNLSISLHEPTNLHLDPPVDLAVVPSQLIVPTLPLSVGAQSFSGAFYSGSMPHGLHGDLGYALQRPGVVPTGPAGAHLNQIPMLNPMYMHHHVAPQPPSYQVPPYLNSSSYNSRSSDFGHISSASHNGVPSHFGGPLSPQSHHNRGVPVPQDHFPHDRSLHYESRQMQLPQQYSIDPNYDDLRNNWSHLNQGNYRGRSM